MVAEVKLPEIYSPLIGSTSKGPNNLTDIIIWNESNYKLEDKKVHPERVPDLLLGNLNKVKDGSKTLIIW